MIATYTLLILFVGSASLLFWDLMQSRSTEDGSVIPGLNGDALRMSAGYAAFTLLFWTACFWLVDRYKPQYWKVLLLVVGWGACVAVTLSYYANSWIASKMAVFDQMSGVEAIRAAVFVAPFVEEFSKACIIFLIAVLDRNRFSSRVSGAVIGGLAGAGFAFTENIVYYARAIVYGSYTQSAGDVAAAVRDLVMLRGVYTCFGHPLFTLMTGVGVAFAVASRSKIVRVVAPVAGYLTAAFLHMVFNGLASVMGEGGLLQVYLWFGLPMVVIVAIRVVMTSVKQGRTVSARLSDYVTMGWLPETYPAAFSRMRRRAWTLIMSPWHGNVWRTWQLQRTVTELAFLRESITRGVVDQAGLWSERDLIERIGELENKKALADGTGLRPYLPWRHKIRALAARTTAHSRQMSLSQGLVPLKYSAVDPRWGPPV
jgi:RsiW-degrading membrane proteinase PrsW (M82 family)